MCIAKEAERLQKACPCFGTTGPLERSSVCWDRIRDHEDLLYRDRANKYQPCGRFCPGNGGGVAGRGLAFGAFGSLFSTTSERGFRRILGALRKPLTMNLPILSPPAWIAEAWQVGLMKKQGGVACVVAVGAADGEN